MFVLRWGHALVWVLLATSMFVRGLLGPAGQPTANSIALAGLGMYLIFLGAFITTKKTT